MILADKITEERKKNGWSQEELANQLGVSRQAVSKWESAGAVPDLQRILQMSELFGVSTDYLLKDEMKAENITYHESTESYAEPLKKVTMEHANEFLDMKRNGSKVVANATSMCILSPILLIVLVTMAEDGVFHVSESLATVFGCVFLLGMVAAAVFLFITYGMRESHMEHFEKECFETEYGVSGMVREKKDSYEPIFIRGTAVGVVLCILAVIPTIISQLLAGKEEIKLGSLTPTRDFNYVKDTAAGFIAIAESDKTIGQEINIATQQEISIGDLAQEIISQINPNAHIVCDEQRLRPEKSEVNRLLGCNAKIKELTDWKQQYTFEQGIAETIAWIRQHMDAYKTDIYNV